MTRPMILSASIAEPLLSDPLWAGPILELAESAGIDLLLLGRADAVPFDAQVLAAWAAPRTQTVGIVPCVSTRTAHPFHAARTLSAVDFLSSGRCGWNPVAGPGDPAAKVADMVNAARSLWDGWDGDALIIDPDSGRYLDGSKIRRSNYAGPFFEVRGPLNAARPPQGHPVLVVDAASPFDVDGIDVAIAATGEPRPAANRHLLRTKVGADAPGLIARWAAGEIDGVHFDLHDAATELPLIAAAFAASCNDRVNIGDLRTRLGLPLEARQTLGSVAA